jgi:citrate lyase subunit beta/citryl-CoA lyase
MSDLPRWFMSDCETLRRDAQARPSGLTPGSTRMVCDLTKGSDAREKRQHRRDLSQWLDHGGHAIVRVNELSTPFCGEDVEEVLGRPGLEGLLLPDVRVPAALRSFTKRIARADVPVWAEIASAEGVTRTPELCAVDGVEGLVFHPLRFAEDLTATPTENTLAYARSAIATASRAFLLDRPVEYEVDHAELGAPQTYGFGAVLHYG